MLEKFQNKISTSIINWLLDGDPSIRWQVQKDILEADEKIYEKERLKISKEGWGYKLLSLQDKEGTWAQSLYNRKWISTTYTMMLLRELGLEQKNQQVSAACKILWEKGIYKDGGINFWDNYNNSETCVTGIILSILSYFSFDKEKTCILADHLLNQQMNDGGWNCRSFKGDTHSSFHTTINVLEGLGEYSKNYHKNFSAVKQSIKKGFEFLLIHRLFRSHRTGSIIDSRMIRLSFPPGWHYDILRALDFFQENNLPKDERVEEAIEIILNKMDKKGRLPLQQKYPGKTFFDMERTGKPSRWNTLRGMRVLKWWNK